MRKTIEPTRLHKDGGYECKHVVKRRIDGKDKYFPVTKYVWFEGYPTKKACELAAKVKESECIEEALAKAEVAVTSQMAVTKKAETKIWTLKEVALDRIQKYGDASMSSQFNTVIRMAGDTLPADFKQAYFDTIKELEETKYQGKYRSTATINRFRSVFSMVLNHAKTEGVVSSDSVLIKFNRKREKGRDIIWTPEQRAKIFEVMEATKSWLLYAVYFSQFNPIRASDLFGNKRDGNPGLRKHNWNKEANWIQFYASKTDEEFGKYTYLKQLDETLRRYLYSLPDSCDHLFPKISPDGICTPIDHLHQGYKNEWKRIRTKAGVPDLHFHDLRHCAETFLLQKGYTRDYLKECNIHRSDTMIDRYYHYDPNNAPVIAGFEKPTLKLYQEAVWNKFQANG